MKFAIKRSALIKSPTQRKTGTDETEREAAYDGHVFGAVTAAVAREIVLELDVEQPVHALYAPVTAHSVSEPVDIERGRRDIQARLERAAIGYSTREKTLARVFM